MEIFVLVGTHGSATALNFPAAEGIFRCAVALDNHVTMTGGKGKCLIPI